MPGGGGEGHSHSLGCHDESGKSIATGSLFWEGHEGSCRSAGVEIWSTDGMAKGRGIEEGWESLGRREEEEEGEGREI